MTDPKQPISYPLIIRFAKAGLMRFVGHLDWQSLQQAMFIKAGLRIVVSEGPSHRLKMKTSPPTPVAVESMTELTYLLLAVAIYPDEAKRRLSEQCPDGIEVVTIKDAMRLARKNPFSAIEAASYELRLGDGISETIKKSVIESLEDIKSDRIPDDIEPDNVKQFWGRIIEIKPDAESIRLMVLQKEGETFHAAKCAGFLEERLNLPHYPLFTKLDYYRLKPSMRRLFI